jgi:hypothetical protein
MSAHGTWFVMCDAARAIPIADVQAKVQMPSKATPRVEGDVLVLAVATPDGDECVVRVALDTSDVVRKESAELADEYGAGRPDHDQIAAFDARYAITWVLAESERVFDTYYTIAYRLRRAVGGVTLDTVEQTFVEA